MRDLFVSLGHNSSAVLAVDGQVVRGYEQERLDRVKSSSAFPKEAIERALGADDFCDRVFVSHWFDQLELEDNKYVDVNYLSSLSPELISLSRDFTHHDAHASSARDFVDCRQKVLDAYVVVLDGFGTNQECFSVYDVRAGDARPRLRHRTYGYTASLGLMYQYVTEYMGLKPHRDEYKLLGYESWVTSHNDYGFCVERRNDLSRIAKDHAHRMVENSHYAQRPPAPRTLIDYDELVYAKAQWTELADLWMQSWSYASNQNQARANVAFCAQAFLEECVKELVKLACTDRSKELILAGGCFLNVKLSRVLRLMWPQAVHVHPLCGDQGAAMGHVRVESRGLSWGRRTIGAEREIPQGCLYVDESNWVGAALSCIDDEIPVNVVRGCAEYGPRALCNTTTFAAPTRESVRLINALNDRDEAMPMAPVMTRPAAMRLLEHDELLRCGVSDKYMVTTVAFKEEPGEELAGVSHKDPLGETWTARPQVVDEGAVAELLSHTRHGCLINTSFNYHGEPIVQSEQDAIRTHSRQVERAKALGLTQPVTLLVRS